MLNIAEATYDELKAARQEINQRIRDLERTAIEELKIRAHQLGFMILKNEEAVDLSPKKPVIKYRDHEGNTWSGGRGRKPEWVQRIIDEGGDIEEYRV